jgi:hypothetical protein
MRILIVLLVLASLAYADVVVVGKREIRGEVVEENDEHVKIRVRGVGVMTIPRAQVKEVRHEDELETVIGEARALSKTLDAKGLSLFDRAIELATKKGDADRAAGLRKERSSLASRLEKQAAREAATAPSSSSSEDARASADDPFLLEADLEEVRVFVNGYREGDKARGKSGAARLVELGNRHRANNEDRWAVGCFALARSIDPEDGKSLWTSERAARLRACGQAIRERDGKIARLAIAGLVKEEPKDVRIAYLEGRALEVSGNPVGARDSFRRALDGVAIPGIAEMAVDWMRELARRRVCGQDLGPGSPGVGEQWRRVETAHFVVYHELGDDFTDEEPHAFEDARAASLARLGLGDGDVNGDKVPMFLFKSRENYVKGGGPEWAGGNVGIVTLEEGEVRTVYVFPGRHFETAVMQHEVGHILVGEAYPRLLLPTWATEGVACYCEPDASRALRTRTAAGQAAAGTLVPLKDFLARASLPNEQDQEGIKGFYAEATVVFAAIAAKAGSVKQALEVAERIARKGGDAGLRELGTDVAALEAELKTDLAKGR